jgi:hypothetical protein
VKRFLSPNRLLLGVLLLLTMLHASALAAFTAETDREVIDENDILRLTLRIDEQIFIGEPDFAPLEQDFTIMSQQRASQFTLVNGQTESETSWTLTLQPKRRGTLQIPALAFKGQQTAPLRVRVTAPSAAAQEALRALVFMESAVSTDSAYVQEQFTLTVSLWYAAGAVLFGDFPPPPTIPNVLVYPLGDAEPGRRQRDGRRYNTITQRYALIPQRSGVLRLPPQSFAGAVRIPEGGRTRRKNLRAQTPRHELSIQPVPAGWPDGAPWLPARNLTLEAIYAPALASAQVGVPLEQTLRLRAEGVAASTLPPLPAPRVPGLRTYDSQTALEEAVRGPWLQAEQRTVTVLMPEEAGALSLPTLSLPWWDTQADALRYATLPGAQLRVAEGTLSALPEASPSAKPAEATPTFGADSAKAPPVVAPLEDEPAPEEEAPPEDSRPLGPAWGGLFAALVALLGAVGLWRRQGRSTASAAPTGQGAQESPRKALLWALAAEDRDAAYAALLRWQRSPEGRAASETLQTAVHEALASLGAERYGRAPTAGSLSWEALKALAVKLAAREKKPPSPPLPALYPP